MQHVEPKVYLVSRPSISWDSIIKYLDNVGGTQWAEDKTSAPYSHYDAQTLVEFAGRLCYKSWKPGLNRNVTRIRKDQSTYFNNLLDSGHGSVLEHAQYSFILQNVSRVFTHELVRHRVGVGISQESLRFVRTDEIKMWLPEILKSDEAVATAAANLVEHLEEFAASTANLLALDEPGVDFHTKKEATSAIRRLLPQGMATDLVWSANIRTLRHCVEARTAPGAEVEMRLVFDAIGRIMLDECPLLFSDYEVVDGAWTTPNRKV